MRKLLFAFLLLPLCSMAQLEVGINGGVLLGNTGPTVTTNIGTIYGAGLYYHFNNFRFAAGYDANKLNISDQLYYVKPMSDLYAGVDYMWSVMYVGVHAGATSIPATNHTQYTYFGSPNTTTTSGSGFMYGVHLGFYFRIFNQVFLNAQVGYSVVNNTLHESYNPGSASYPSNVDMAPVIVGLHYRFNLKKSKKVVKAG